MYPVNSGVNELQAAVYNVYGTVINQIANQGIATQNEILAIQNTFTNGGLTKFCNDFSARLTQYDPHTGQRFQAQFNPNELHHALYAYVIAILNALRHQMSTNQQVQVMQPQQLGMGGVVQQQQVPPGTIVNGMLVRGPNMMQGQGMINQGMVNTGGNPLSEVYGPKIDTNALLNAKVPNLNPTEIRNKPMTRMEFGIPTQPVANPVEIASATNTIYQPPVSVHNAVMDAIRETERAHGDVTIFDRMLIDESEEEVTVLDRSKENAELMDIINSIGGQTISSMVVYATDTGSEILALNVDMDGLYSNWENAKNDFLNVIKSSSIKSEYPRYFYHISYYEKVVLDTPLLKVVSTLNELRALRKAINLKSLSGLHKFIKTILGINDHKLKDYISSTIVDEFNKAANMRLMYVDPSDNQNSFIFISKLKDIVDIALTFSGNDMPELAEYSKYKLWMRHFVSCVRHAVNVLLDDTDWFYLDVVENSDDRAYALAMEDNGIRYSGKNSRLSLDAYHNEDGTVNKSMVSQLASRTIMVRKCQKAYTNLNLPTRAMELKAGGGYHSDSTKNALHQILMDLADKYPVIHLDLTDTNVETDKYCSGTTLEDALVIYRTY